MARRDIIRIDEEKCDGCGRCVGACAEGAIALVDGKARLVSETYCDGLGACLGECPRGAISIESAEAQPFDRAAVEAHLGHAQPASGTPLPAAPALPVRPHAGQGAHGGGCPGSRSMAFAPAAPASLERGSSALAQWPVQLHLLSPLAPYLRGADLVLAADCVAYAVGDFHARFLAGRRLAIACPKLDQHQEVYLEKLTAMIDEGAIRSLTVVVMEVPCCAGLAKIATAAASRAARKASVDAIVVGVTGEVRATGHLLTAPVA